MSPLELFNVKNIISLNLKYIDLSITNTTIYLCTPILIFFIIKTLFINTNENRIILNRWQIVIYNLISIFYKELYNVLKLKNNNYIPLLLSLFFFILLNNLIGLIPYNFTTTAQIIVTFILSGTVMIGVTILGLIEHKHKFLGIFLPKGIPSIILPLIFIIEIISYISRIFSLSVRLTANMVAGHTLLFIISSFSLNLNIFLKLILFAPILVLFFILEIGVSFIQAYVFTILTATYIKDVKENH